MRRVGIVLLAMGWTAFVISFFVTAADTHGSMLGNPTGWRAVVGVLIFALLEIEKKTIAGVLRGIVLFLSVASNLVMLLSPLFSFATTEKIRKVYRLVISLFTIFNAHWIVMYVLQGAGRTLVVGYYLWFGSFVAVSVGLYLVGLHESRRRRAYLAGDAV